MACVALSSLMRTMELELLNPGRSAIVDDEEQVKYLYQSLGFLKELLHKSKDNIAAKNLEPKIKDLAFQIEDRIEKKLETIYGEAYSEAERQKAERRLPSTLKQAISDTEDLMVEIRKILDSPVQDFPSADPPASSKQAAASNIIMEGRGQKFEEIMKQLIPQDSSSGREVISILGMGGIGKTTLARRLYEDPLVLSYFDILGWTVVSQTHDVRKMLLDLLRPIDVGHRKGKDGEQADSEPTNIDELTDGELAERLRKCLMGRKYLIVMDDIWSISAWEHIQLCFPDNSGSRILLTTRHKEVADSADSGNRLHTLGSLNSKESWNLFCKSFPAEQPLPLQLKTIGYNIVDKCHGLPLAIVVVAGVLSKLNKTVEEWKNFEKQTNSLVVTTDLTEQCSRILTLSYNYLPLHLKACFLYLSTVPEDKEILVKRLVRLWIAEGFVEVINSEKLEEVARGYLQDLVDRSLILIHNRCSNGKIKMCRLHDIVHEFCVREAIKEKLLNVGNKRNPHNLQQEGCRWLHFWPETRNDDDFRGFDNLYIPRSILYLHTSYTSSEVIDPDLRWGLLLRVLELSHPISSGACLNYISLLRYLDICLGHSSFQVKDALRMVSRSRNLQTLIMSHKQISGSDERSCHLSSEMWASQELSHVECSYLISFDPPNEVKEKLHTLYWLSLRHCTEEVFSRIPNVRKLGISCQPKTDDDHQAKSRLNILDNLHHLNQLETLKIAATESPRPRYICLRNPQAFPQNLKELTLVWTRLPWKHISVIGYMPCLEVLKLKNEAVCGKAWEPSEGGFCRLKFLLVQCKDFRYWKATADHYPVLEHLLIRDCPSLKEIPSSFADISTLHLIELNRCHRSLVTSAKQIQQQQQELGNDDFDVRAYNTLRSLSLCEQVNLTYRVFCVALRFSLMYI